MKAVILAAGSSTRLYPLTLDRPKCLLEIGGKTLLEYQLRALAACQVRELVLVVGYLSQQILQAVEDIRPTIPLSAVYNRQYATTNNLYSLWAAREKLAGSPFICLHADLLLHPGILEKCPDTERDICLAVDREIHPETMKVAIESGRVTQVGKGITPEAISGTFLGIATCSAEAGRMVLDEVEALVEAKQTRAYFTAAIERLIGRGISVGFWLTDGLPWIEVDFLHDLERARQEIYPKMAEALSQSSAKAQPKLSQS